MVEKPTSFVLGDWGTSNLRLFCVVGGKIIDTTVGPGVGQLKSGASEIITQLLSSWEEYRNIEAVYLCGMVGSSLGLVEVPHHQCPMDWTEIGQASQSASVNGISAHIVPGLSCTNPLIAPDYLRGEETQIVGTIKVLDKIRYGMQLLCLCGTHTKWVWIEEGRINVFLTSLAGELFESLTESVLVKETVATRSVDATSLRRGIKESGKHDHADLLHQLFQVRSRKLSGDLSGESATGFLSGLIVGTDVSRALQISRTMGKTIDLVTIVGAKSLTDQYELACTHFKTKCITVDGQQASLAGLASIFDLNVSMDNHVTH